MLKINPRKIQVETDLSNEIFNTYIKVISSLHPAQKETYTLKVDKL